MASEIKVDTIVNAGGDNDSGIDLATNDVVKVNIAGTEKARVHSDGKLQTDHLVNLSGDSDSGLDLSSNDVVAIKTANSERMRVDSSGNVLVGGTNNDDGNDGIKLRASGELVVEQDDSLPVKINRKTSDGELIRLQKDGSTCGSLANIGQAPVFRNVNEDGISVLTDGGRAILVSTNNSGIQDDDGQIGTSTYRWNKAYIKNGVTTGSDQNEKQNIENLTSKELNVANKLSALFKTYKWKDSVAEKGDKARTHSGIIAQDIQSAFSAEGLDASDYGMFMSDTWWEKEITVDGNTTIDKKNEKTDGYTERTRLGVRYTELFSFIFSSIEARLTALESK
tara:strand:+ start:334 stop:1347 length:1014 start_codon:yes stop_codon:yes gene_type:complete